MKVIARQLRLVTILLVGWGLQAQAQPTDFSLPPLPPLSGGSGSSISGNSPIPAPPELPNIGSDQDKQSKVVGSTAPSDPVTQPSAPPAFPELAGLPPAIPVKTDTATTPPATTDATTAPTTDTAATDTTTPAPASDVTVGPTQRVPSTDSAAVTPSPPGLPSLPLPPNLPAMGAPIGPTTKTTTATATSTPAAPTSIFATAPKVQRGWLGQTMSGGPDATAAAPVDVPNQHTWYTRLAPAIVPPKTSFNYRRQVLPDAIYKKQYDRDNDHLPVAVTREDYTRLLFERVAANDIDATRALLNTGLPVTLRDGSGQSLLGIARQYNARDTANLLIARGATS